MANKYVTAIEKIKEMEQAKRKLVSENDYYLDPEKRKIFYRQGYNEKLCRDYIYRCTEQTIATQYSDVIEEIKNNCAIQAQELEYNEIPHAKEELELLEALPRMSESDFKASFPNVNKMFNFGSEYLTEHQGQIIEIAQELADKLLSDNKIDEKNAEDLKQSVKNIKHNKGFPNPSIIFDKNRKIISCYNIYMFAFYKFLMNDLQQNYGDELEKLSNLAETSEVLDSINNIDKHMDECIYDGWKFNIVETIPLIKNYNNYQQAKSNLNNLELKCKNYQNALNNGYISTRINEGWYYLTFSELMTYGVIEQMLKTEGLAFNDLTNNKGYFLSEALEFFKLPENEKEIFNKPINQLTQEERELLEKNYKDGDAIITQMELSNLSSVLGNPEIITEITPEMLEEAVKNFPDFQLNTDYENIKTI